MTNKPFQLPSAMKSATEAVTKTWAKQRKAEERNRNAMANRQYRLVRARSMFLREAAFEVRQEAYQFASGGLPVKARQVMYAARPKILKLTDKDHLDDAYFTQTLLPDYMEEHDCSDWDIVWDARGTFYEPHTKRAVPIGTLEVRQYLDERPEYEAAVEVADNSRFPTKGPENRFNTVLFVEKEGFAPLLKAARIAERFDLALMSTKGMSTTSARMLLDRLVDRGVKKVLVLRDFDISGFSIFGTLFTDSRRYAFVNAVPIIDLGLRLSDVVAMGLQSEPVTFETLQAKTKKADTLRRHGATTEEIAFLMGPVLPPFIVAGRAVPSTRGKRVELNAMTNRQFIDFVEQKLEEHGVEKVIPDDEVLIRHARRVLEQKIAAKAVAKLRERIAKEAAETKLPEGLRRPVEQEFQADPSMSWDIAVANIVGRLDEEESDTETEEGAP
jgi:hypothetical protein